MAARRPKRMIVLWIPLEKRLNCLCQISHRPDGLVKLVF